MKLLTKIFINLIRTPVLIGIRLDQSLSGSKTNYSIDSDQSKCALFEHSHKRKRCFNILLLLIFKS